MRREGEGRRGGRANILKATFNYWTNNFSENALLLLVREGDAAVPVCPSSLHSLHLSSLSLPLHFILPFVNIKISL